LLRGRLASSWSNVSMTEPGDAMPTLAIRPSDRERASASTPASASGPSAPTPTGDDITIDGEPESQVVVFEARDVAVRYSGVVAVEGVTLDVFAQHITALIGPSGCGKSTFLRTFNRMNDLIAGAKVSGHLGFHGHDLYAADVDPIEVRRRIGMVFPIPSRSRSSTMSRSGPVSTAGARDSTRSSSARSGRPRCGTR
jgi:ABC-type glutathione transport system ATPase component